MSLDQSYHGNGHRSDDKRCSVPNAMYPIICHRSKLFESSLDRGVKLTTFLAVSCLKWPLKVLDYFIDALQSYWILYANNDLSFLPKQHNVFNNLMHILKLSMLFAGNFSKCVVSVLCSFSSCRGQHAHWLNGKVDFFAFS